MDGFLEISFSNDYKITGALENDLMLYASTPSQRVLVGSGSNLIASFSGSNLTVNTVDAQNYLNLDANPSVIWGSNAAVYNLVTLAAVSNDLYPQSLFASSASIFASNIAVTNSNTLFPQGLFSSNTIVNTSNDVYGQFSTISGNVISLSNSLQWLKNLESIDCNTSIFSSNVGVFSSNLSIYTSNVTNLTGVYASNAVVSSSNFLYPASIFGSNLAVWGSNNIQGGGIYGSNVANFASNQVISLSNFSYSNSSSASGWSVGSNVSYSMCNVSIGSSNLNTNVSLLVAGNTLAASSTAQIFQVSKGVAPTIAAVTGYNIPSFTAALSNGIYIPGYSDCRWYNAYGTSGLPINSNNVKNNGISLSNDAIAISIQPGMWMYNVSFTTYTVTDNAYFSIVLFISNGTTWDICQTQGNIDTWHNPDSMTATGMFHTSWKTPQISKIKFMINQNWGYTINVSTDVTLSRCNLLRISD
jgi:hypothetical protein